MRCMSFGLENCEKKDGNYKFSDLLKYNFYLPFFFFGPVMTFDRYHAQVRRPAPPSLRLCSLQLQRIKSQLSQANRTRLIRNHRELWNITSKALVHLALVLVVDVFFHFLYILSIPSDMKLVAKLSDWCLGGSRARFWVCNQPPGSMTQPPPAPLQPAWLIPTWCTTG